MKPVKDSCVFVEPFLIFQNTFPLFLPGVWLNICKASHILSQHATDIIYIFTVTVANTEKNLGFTVAKKKKKCLKLVLRARFLLKLHNRFFG